MQMIGQTGIQLQGMPGLQTASCVPYYHKADNVCAVASHRLVMRCTTYVQADPECFKQYGTVGIGVTCCMFSNEHAPCSTVITNFEQTWWMLQALAELALDYENDKANVPVPIMYDDETAYLCDQGSA